jgi:plasmid stabilization system protein ParE
VKLRITPRAQSQARGRRAWWAEHRPAAPSLFDEELEQTLRLISETPEVGLRWPTARNPELRRLLMPKTHNHVYFYVDRHAAAVIILAVWGAARGRGPRL